MSSTVERAGAYAWRLIGIGIVVYATLWLLALLRVVVFPVLIALLLSVALVPPARWLRARGVPHVLSVWMVLLGLLGTLVLAGFLILPALAEEFGSLGPTIEEAAADIEDWLVEDGPFDVDRQQLDDLRAQAEDRLASAARGADGLVLDTAVLILEIVAGLLLALVATFFFVKDGERFQRWALARAPADRRESVRRAALAGWQTLGGYLRGSALLGTVEAVVIGLTLLLTGASVVIPVAILTFLAAFIPFVGAIAAGVIAVAVALATGGLTAALIVAGVALVVQQLDNDLLAPIVFGRALDLHPLVILVSVAAGAALAGLAGAFLAVPVTACTVNVIGALTADDGAGS